MTSGSVSEGEIVDSGSEKANTAQPSTQFTSVNRRLRDALSPTPEATTRSPSPTGNRLSRNHSRSPTRTSRTPRGEKRRRPDDHYRDSFRGDSRRFKTPYDRPGYLVDQRRTPYNDLDRNQSQRTNNRYDDHESRDQSARKIGQMSKSEKDVELYNRRPSDHFLKAGTSRNTDDRNGRGSYQQRGSGQHSLTHSGRPTLPNDPYMSQEAETPRETPQQYSASANGSSVALNSGEKGALEHDASVHEAPQQLETLTAEERRRRREAIKAKHRNNTSTLLVQTLQQSVTPGSPGSPIDTPETGPHRSVSPSVDSPGTLEQNSVANSPSANAFVSNVELANSYSAMSVDEASGETAAADYDPKMDMEEDRIRGGNTILGKDLNASDYNEMDIDREKQILMPESKVKSDGVQPKKQEAVDDMFASDDDDDMFAPESSKGARLTNREPNVAVSMPKARELDESLLDNWDDGEFYYKTISAELLDGKYQVQGQLGKGMFATVVRAIDIKTKEVVAIKIVRKIDSMTKAGQKEMEVLQKLADADPEDKKHIVRLHRSFSHKGHLCMVFENLKDNLREILKTHGRRNGLHLKAVRAYAQQSFLGLTLLRKCNIVHADLKPDNILVNEKQNMLKICDLGSALDASDNNEITRYLASRFYRAPEIILGFKPDFAIDMWSMGCTLYELYTGHILFTGNSNNQMLKHIMEWRGRFSPKMLRRAEYGGLHFEDKTYDFRSQEIDPLTRREIVKIIRFINPTRDLKGRLMETAKAGQGTTKLPDEEIKEINMFYDLLDRCLTLNPEKRITPMDALKHPFINRAIPSQSVGRA